MKIKVFTVCSGYDSQCMALDMLKKEFDSFDYELVGWSEIDPHAIELHNLFYPQWSDRNFGDVTKVDWANVPDFDLFTYSTPCFVKGAMVLTSNGYKPIENVEVGDMVLTHTNQYKMVTETMQHPANDLVKINAMMLDGLVCTGNHPFYVRKKVRKGHWELIPKVEFEGHWVAIRKLTPYECLRLMGVNEENIDKVRESGIRKTHIYKAAGNSIVVHNLYHIFKKLYYLKVQRGEQLKLF